MHGRNNGKKLLAVRARALAVPCSRDVNIFVGASMQPDGPDFARQCQQLEMGVVYVCAGPDREARFRHHPLVDRQQSYSSACRCHNQQVRLRGSPSRSMSSSRGGRASAVNFIQALVCHYIPVR